MAGTPEITKEPVVTGEIWMGRGIGAIESALEHLFREAQNEIIITTYSISVGARLLFEWLENAAARGVRIIVVVNRLSQQPKDAINRLRQISALYSHLEMFSFDGTDDRDLHAKVFIFDRSKALIGSSNLSRRGLLLNHEMAVILEGSAVIQVSAAVDRLMTSQYLTAM
jgi:phosphatidylserine/phosphatidylglycerophosphate/cardiolipin synthase-like enzyme